MAMCNRQLVALCLSLFFFCFVAFTAAKQPTLRAPGQGTLLQVWTCTGGASQQFALQNAPNTTGSVFNIVYKPNGMCIDIANYMKTPNANVWIWSCHPYSLPYNQQWTINPNGTITTKLDGMCLTVYNYGSGSLLGAGIVVAPCNGDKTQQWTVNRGTNVIQSATGYCMDVGSMLTCENPALKNLTFCDYTRPVDQRVNDLVSRLNAVQLYNQMGNNAPSIATLAIPQYNWWTECLHGVLTGCGKSCPTSFPAASCMGASFNMSLIHEVATAISNEARALHNQGIGGLDFWAPNININRDPRWGRNQEVPGEDPYLTAEYVKNFMRGLQEGDDPHYTKVVGTCKHYAAYSLEDWGGQQRYGFNAIVSDYDLVDTYLPAWQSCVVEGRARSVMCSYNAVNGVPTCASDFLLQTVLRDGFGFDGYVVSDCDAVACIEYNHHYTNNGADTCGVAVKAGCDLDCGAYYQNHMAEALGNGTVSVADLKKAVSRLFKQRFELGMWDPPQMQPYTKLPPSVVDSPAHSHLALRAARESLVLLKNDNKLLPLSKSRRSIAVIGPNANVTDTLLSNYYGQRCLDGSFNCITTPLNAIKKIVSSSTTINYAKGCDVTGNSTTGFAAALSALSSSEVGIVFLGLDQNVESEGHDRTSISLPGKQEALIKVLAGLGKPLVVVLINGGSIAIEWIKDNIPAILEAGYPGENGAQAIAEVLFGDYNPGGKLTVTVYPADYVNQVPLTNMSMRAASNNPGRTYRYYTGKPLWEFGHGLSYTTFRTVWSQPPASVVKTAAPTISFRANVTNTGTRAGDEVVLAFVKRSSSDNGPLKQLFGFQRVHLTPGETKEVFFSSPPSTFAVAAEEGLKRVIYPGTYQIEVGVGEDKLVHPFRLVGPSHTVSLY